MVEGARELSGASFIRALTPFMRAPPSLPNHLPKATPPNTVTFQGQDVIGELHYTSIQCITSSAPSQSPPNAKLRSALGLPLTHLTQALLFHCSGTMPQWPSKMCILELTNMILYVVKGTLQM